MNKEETIRITESVLNTAKTPRGGYTSKQIRFAQEIYGSKWKQGMLKEHRIPISIWERFIGLGKRRVPNKSQTIINPISKKGRGDWSYKPTPEDIPPIKLIQKKPKKNKRKRHKVSKQKQNTFYQSPEWRKLRTRVLEKYQCKCMMCGRTPKEHGVVIHVDHIKPISTHPELALEFNNLQILCEDCNIGKLNRYTTDYRSTLFLNEDYINIEEELDKNSLVNIPDIFYISN